MWIRRFQSLAAAMLAGLLAACGNPAPAHAPLPCPLPGSASARAAIVPAIATGPVIVSLVLHPTVPDLPGTAAYLTLRHGGRLLRLEPGGFAVEVHAGAIADLEREPQVCAVVQELELPAR